MLEAVGSQFGDAWTPDAVEPPASGRRAPPLTHWPTTVHPDTIVGAKWSHDLILATVWPKVIYAKPQMVRTITV
jgi:hypothetical protein